MFPPLAAPVAPKPVATALPGTKSSGQRNPDTRS